MRYAATVVATASLVCLAGAYAQQYTGTYSDGGAATLVLDQYPSGTVSGHMVMSIGLFEVEAVVTNDGRLEGSLASGANSFFRFIASLDTDRTTLHFEALAVDVAGRPLGTPAQSTRLTRVSYFGIAPETPLPTSPGQVPGRPDAVVLPEPGSFRPGARLVFYMGAASLRESRIQAMEDPTCAETRGPDCYYQPETDKWYRVKDVLPLGSIGILQFDLLHLDTEVCVARLTEYGLDPITGLVTYLGSDGFVGRFGTCGELWLPPDRLVAAARQNPGSPQVFHGPYMLGGRSFDAVRLGATSVSGEHQTYQASTGILIIASDRTTGSALTIGPDLFLRQSAISTHLAHTQFLSLREIGGYTGEPLPQHVLTANRLVYSCTNVMSMPGVPDVQTPCQQEVYLGERASHWALIKTVQHDPNSVTGRTWSKGSCTVASSRTT